MAGKTKAARAKPVSLDVPYPAKVEIPKRRQAIVRRQRLVEALAEAAGRRIAVVTAPPGYGKTTLLVDFAQSFEGSVCWYSLDERDINPATFLRYFVAAGRAQFPEFGAELAAALNSGEELPAGRLTDLLVAATASAGGGFIFMLDDFHCLDSAPDDLRKAFEGWLYRLPPDVHVVLSGRSRPQIAVLPMMEVRQEVGTITAADFSFTCDEVELLFREVLGKEISPDESQRLADLTEGWAGALVLLAERPPSGSGDVALEQLRGSDTLFQYISLEQFDPLPGEVREFLLGSAVLRTLDAPIVDELLGTATAEEKLTFLARLNLLVTPDDPQQPRRYHRLFRAFLVSKLRASDPARFRELNEKAARIGEAAQQWDDAVYHYIQAAAWDSIIQITDRVGSRMFEEGHWETLGDWLEAVPDEEPASRPKLMLWKAKVLHYLNRVDRALSILAQAVDTLEASEDWITLAQALVGRGMCLRVKGDYAESRNALTRARTLLIENDAPLALVTEARKELGITLYRSGNLNESIEELTAVVEVFEAQGDQYNLAHSLVELAASLAFAGKLAATINYLERARILWEVLGHPYFLVQVLNNLGMTYYLQGDLVKAEEIFLQGLAKARESNNMRELLYLTACLADLKKELGEYSIAHDMYRTILDDSWAVNDAYFRVYIMNALADNSRLMGDINQAELSVQMAKAEADKTGGAIELGISLMTAGLIKRQQQDLKAAVDCMEQAIVCLKEKGAWRELAIAKFHLAGLYFSLKKKTLALQMLESCATLVKEMGYDHFLVVEASRNPLLVQYASANKIADGFYARMLKLSKGAVATPAASDEDGDTSAASDGTRVIYAFALGNVRVEIDGREISDLEWRSEKSKEMFLFFLANGGSLRKEEIVTALWPDMAEDKTTSAFHSNMYRLRKALYQDVVAKDSGRYILDPQARFVFDVNDYQQALQQIAAMPKGSPAAIAVMERAMNLYKGPFASDFYSEWAQTLRPQLEEQHMSLLGSLAAAYNEAGEYKKSADICQRILDVDEFNETAWYRLMSNYIQDGQAEAARYCYTRYVKIIAEDDPDDTGIPEFEEIVRELAAKRTA